MIRFGKYIRFFVGIVLIYIILRRIDFSQLKLLFSNVQFKYVFLILSLLAMQTLIKAYKWHILMKAKNLNVPVTKIFQLDYVSTFLSLFFPSSISVDIFRGYGISKEMVTKKDAASSIIADRLISLFALLFLANLSVYLFLNLIQNLNLVYLISLILIGLVLLSIILSNNYLSRIFTHNATKINSFKIVQKLNELRQSVVNYKNHKLSLLAVFSLSLIMQISRIFIYFFAALALKNQIPIQYFIAFVPVIMLVIMLPISMAGIGVREGSFIYFFTAIGLAYSTAFAISFLVSILVIVAVLPGGVIYAIKGLTLRHDSVYSEEEVIKTDCRPLNTIK